MVREKPMGSDIIMCFMCGERPSVAYHPYFWDMLGTRIKVGFLCCGHCMTEDLKKRILAHSVEDVAAFQCFLDECYEESGGKFDIIPVGRDYHGSINWFKNLKVDNRAMLH